MQALSSRSPMTTEAKLIRIRKGLDIPIAGEPKQSVESSPPVRAVALLGRDYIGLKPDLRVAVGDRVKLGQALFEDRSNPGVQFTAPASGTIAAIHRGPRRRLESVVIDRHENGQRAFEAWSRSALDGLGRSAICQILQASGLWTAFRTRPYGRVPRVASEPAAIFVTALDTNPLAADPGVIIATEPAAFADGLRIVRQLTDGKVYVCSAPGRMTECPPDERIEPVAFAGPHPAGLVGTHIHCLHPVDARGTVWHVNYQDVMAIGRLFVTGHLDATRIVSLAGPHVRHPRLVSVPVGAHVDEVLAGELKDGPYRIVSGSPLSGRRAAGPEAYLGRYHLQLSVLGEATEREFLGWLMPGWRKFSATRMFVSSLFRHRRFDLTTSQNGSPRAMVPIGTFEKVMPLRILITPLLKALLVNDTETAKTLGCLALEEEDLALCSFVCCSKYDYGAALRDTLATLEETG